ncbi:MAG: HNH endonuclease [Deltaproteobacteria bacterium]
MADPAPERSEHTSSAALEAQTSAASRAGSAPPGSRAVIEPLSAQRYRIQFTADAALKQQLELARNLLRHAHPSGDLGPIVARALTLLIDDLMRRRFGAGGRRKRPSSALARPAHTPPPAPAPEPSCDPSAQEQAANAPGSADPARRSTTPTSPPPNARSSPIPRAARRAVLERDGLGCSWVDAHGMRCGSQAWLEIDHRRPRGKDGSSEPENLRLLCSLCRARHNAERTINSPPSTPTAATTWSDPGSGARRTAHFAHPREQPCLDVFRYAPSGGFAPGYERSPIAARSEGLRPDGAPCPRHRLRT